MKTIQFTKQGLENLQKEYDELINVKRPQAVLRLQKARAMGDLSENSEYSAAKEDLAFVEGRIREIEELMKHAQIVEEQHKQGIVDIGCKVIVEKGNIKEEYFIVGEFEADPASRKLSSTSPIGKALLGKRIGEKINITVPAGTLTYTIVAIK